MGTIWTGDLKAKAIDLWSTHTAAEIVIALKREGLHVTRNSVLGMLFRAGITARGVPRVKVERSTRESPIRTVRRAPRQYNPDKIKMRCAGIEPRHLTLLERSDLTDCHFPYGDGPYTYCGHPRKGGSSYCPAHHDLVWVPPTRRAA